MKARRLVVRFDRLPAEMRLGDSAMKQLFRRRFQTLPPDNERCRAAVIVGFNPNYRGEYPDAVLIGSAYRCPYRKNGNDLWCSWHRDGPKGAYIARTKLPTTENKPSEVG